MPGADELLSLASSANPASAGIQAGAGAVQSIIGLINEKKLKKKAAELAARRPKLKSSPYISDQLALAKSELSSGMSAEAKSAYEGGLSRDLSTSLNTILKGGGDVNNVSQVFDASAQGRQRLALIKENLRLNNINNLVRVQDAAEQERKEMFSFNEYQPWADEAQAVGQARQQAQNQIWSGIDTAGSGLMKMFGGGGGSGGGSTNNMSASLPTASTNNMVIPSLTGRQAPANAPALNFNYPDYTDFADLG